MRQIKKVCPHCNRVFGGPWFKRFCCKECRSKYHAARRKEAMALLERIETQPPREPVATTIVEGASRGMDQD